VTPVAAARSPVNIAHYPPGATFGPRELHEFELVWILSGSAVWTIHHPDGMDENFVLLPGTVSLARAGSRESYAWDPVNYSAHAWVHFDLSAPDWLPAVEDWPHTMESRNADPIAALCGYLVSLARSREPNAQDRSAQVLDLVLEVFTSGPFPVSDARVVSAAVAAALEYVAAEWNRDGVRIVSMEEMARAAHVSVGHLGRGFKAQFHMGMSRALELVRLARAAVSLQRSNLSLDGIARDAGFGDRFHFSRRFSFAYGIPPSSYRRQGYETDPLAPLERTALIDVWNITMKSQDRRPGR